MHSREVFDVIDMHAAGEPLRIITGGYPPLHGRTVLDQRDELLAQFDPYRRRLMAEPWGHEDMYGCLLVHPERPDSLYGLIFMHNEGYSNMCGHATIAVTKMLVETGQVVAEAGANEAVVRYDVPSGQIEAHARLNQGRVASVWFENVAASVMATDLLITAGNREVRVDVAFGGAFYVVVDVKEIGLAVELNALDDLRRWAFHLKSAVQPLNLAKHPVDARLDGVYGVIFTDRARESGHFSRHVTVFADGQVDRSPCGSCISARLAVLDKKQRIERNHPLVFESVLDTTFVGTVLGNGPPLGEHATVRTAVEGQAYVTGFRRFYENPFDPLGPFLLR